MSLISNARKLPALALPLALIASLTACMTDSGDGSKTPATLTKQTLFVAHGGTSTLAAYDIASGAALPGEVTNVNGPVDMQALADGTLLVNLTATNQVLIVDGKTMLEKKRLLSSSLGATRPVHSYITPTVDGKAYWMSLNDGAGTAVTNSAFFVGVTPGDTATYLKGVGEVALGIGHHKACFSATKARVAISNISDTSDVVSVFDYSDPAHIQKLAKASVGSLGIVGGRATPHGCGTAKISGRGYCNATATGDIISIDLNAATPTFRLLKTRGNGAGYTKPHPGGRYVYSLQMTPRGGDTVRVGSACQIGQLVVIDGQLDSVVKQVPLLYGATGCVSAVVGTPANSVGPGHILISGGKLFVQMASSATGDYSSKHLVLDITDPADPVQTAALDIGKSRGDHGETLSGDGKSLFVTNSLDGTVTQIDATTGTVAKTITVKTGPATVATWGETEGPSHPTGPLD